MNRDDLIFLVFWIEAAGIWQTDDHEVEMVRHIADEYDVTEDEVRERQKAVLAFLKQLAGIPA